MNSSLALFLIFQVSSNSLQLSTELCMLGIFHAFLSSAYFFSNSTVSENIFRNTIRVSNSLDPDEAEHFVGPDLVPNYLQK